MALVTGHPASRVPWRWPFGPYDAAEIALSQWGVSDEDPKYESIVESLLLPYLRRKQAEARITASGGAEAETSGDVMSGEKVKYTSTGRAYQEVSADQLMGTLGISGFVE